MKPFKTLLFILGVFGILIIISLIIPDDGIKVNENITIHFPAFNDVFNPDDVAYADISGILEGAKGLSYDTLFDNNDYATDSIIQEQIKESKDSLAGSDTLRANADSLKQIIRSISYPGNDRSVLFPFFKALQNLSQTNELIRIIHYGDSQIEGDRITGYVRHRMQKRFGGMGPGLQPPSSLYNIDFSIKQRTSDNWQRYTLLGKPDTTLTHNRFGALATFAEFSTTHDKTEIVEADTISKSAWISFERSNLAYSTARTFRQCQLFYGYNKSPLMLELEINDSLLDADILPPAKRIQKKTWRFPASPQSLKLNFSGTDSPEVYAIALDGLKGVAVDNVALRGNAGLIFRRINQYQLKYMYKELNAKLLILQFGGNVVPYISDDYSKYGEWFYSQLTRLKQINPELSIIVIGVADMSKKEKDKYVSYPNIEPIRDVMKDAAFRAGCAYWDLYEAMGGENSMPSWVFAQPSLASTDFVHFNHRGARVIAEMFYNALIHDYENYLRTQAE